MKTYYIKGKKITVDYLKIDKTIYALLEALDEREALSDKEEWKAPRPFYYDNVIGKLRWSDIHEICSDKEEKFCGGEPCICEPMMQVPKQSTSLKEETEELIYKSIYRDVLTTTETADKVLKLIQSHLVKEVNRYDKEVRGGTGRTDMDDIIKIINNITKQYDKRTNK